MPDSSRISRRYLIAAGLGLGASIGGGKLGAQTRSPGSCPGATPVQIEGPFYPTERRADEDVDLTLVRGHAGRAEGEIIHLRGRVLDEACRPVDSALVEVWQANKWGRYEHERDARNPRPLDPNFQGWARLVTGSEGDLSFKTIKPGSYPADGQGWIRPPHIHFKVSRRGFRELITQMYFDGEPLNERDLIRKGLTPEDLAKVTVAFQPSPDIEAGARRGVFNITLRRVG